ncbi:hypothetical protein VNO78_22492 [Psophocarpus tetragonolobus]|uniref:Uncharacterized protein n=1 Tax=Psophocarpus tetragonolobus TaxID=3891 RepID=A0AAN9XC34_PSOTE
MLPGRGVVGTFCLETGGEGERASRDERHEMRWGLEDTREEGVHRIRNHVGLSHFDTTFSVPCGGFDVAVGLFQHAST